MTLTWQTCFGMKYLYQEQNREAKVSKMTPSTAKRLLELEPEDSDTYVLLSNMYAVSGKWDESNRTKKFMKDRSMKKVSGSSWIEVKKQFIHSLLEQKDSSTCIHSEKLAITFGLLTLSNAVPLRVMKNLRLCHHNWIKGKITSINLKLNSVFLIDNFWLKPLKVQQEFTKVKNTKVSDDQPDMDQPSYD
ncbi:pentatricopeptide repeat (PPR) superfamily protein [Artemisia annua]|uniref:Pentatricopeptide repeat (PPR) superfamily protein n=1 Tax=Artemisia annua TaxID=35608 RepID=A0A2U1PC20_ARTAN|nr:pentatricopeptide repeat (PPR) superfamily protein [Artemisia annua]